jgi:tetratricopeptide (TPR) repeat protein
MHRLRRVGLVLVVAAAAVALSYTLRQQQDGTPALPPFSLEQRPHEGRLLFDYAGLLEHYREGTRKYLHSITRQFHIEAVIVSVPDLGPASNIEELAVDIANRWQIGREYEGRGLLLLLVNEGKQVKLEVAYELEDVFTDAFSGYVEDLQLQPYFLRDDLGTGLIAVMEELEQRAQLRHQGDFTPGQITRLDAELLAGGAGAKRQLGRYRDTEPAETGSYEAADGAKTPQDAWRIMLTKWAGKGAAIRADIYTEMTKLAMGDQNRPDDRTRAALQQWQDAEYQVLGDDDHAVISFGNRKGWNNAPFLFCKTPGGWKFDIVHQRRLVVMGSNPDWKVEQGNYPYVSFLDQVPQSTGKDLPLEPSDLYTCARDEQIAAEMRTLRQRLETSPDDFTTVMALARLNIISGRRPNHVAPLIKRAKKLDPESALPYKYAAIFNVNSFFQYETALQDIETYIEKQPEDAFGYNVKGFLHYRLGNYRKSIDALEQALGFSADNVYSYALMSRDYALLYSKANKLDPRRAGYRKQALAMLHQAETAMPQDTARVDRLKHWLQRRKILQDQGSSD